ncbi:MAG: type II toxin-antitoxin system RelE/ParE family toxin [Gammaproteobacteria bacterium]|nr:type II toxin-antitoxin system RelE/ParE family toxin [Gammaproteobacteria bacterium]
MIKSFADKRTAAVFVGNRVSSLPAAIQPRARQKLLMIDAAARLGDLRAPPSNRLELLRGQRKAQHSIRINDQWRVCFEWRQGDALDVEITDYHR